jgi:uncharacterized membrane protein
MWIKQVLLLSIIILIVDILWLSYGVDKVWQDNVKAVQKSPLEVRKHYALFSYILIILGIWYFVQKNITKETTMKEILISSFLYGFILYGVFDFTNLAIFKEYQWKAAWIDMLWGGFLTMTAVYITTKMTISS